MADESVASGPRESYRQFTFEATASDGEPPLTVTVPEVLDASYGMYVWPSAPVLAQFIFYHKDLVRGKHILELGAGSSLPGIVAAKLGGRVTLSDAKHLDKCLDNCRKSITANDLEQSVKVIGVTWGQFSNELYDLDPVDIILGSDCFYDTKDFEDIIVTVAFLIDRNPKAEFWTTYQVRSEKRTIEPQLLMWGLNGHRIPLRLFDADSPTLAGSQLPGNHTIEMYIISKSDTKNKFRKK